MDKKIFNKDFPSEERAAKLLAEMTLDDKIIQIRRST